MHINMTAALGFLPLTTNSELAIVRGFFFFSFAKGLLKKEPSTQGSFPYR